MTFCNNYRKKEIVRSEEYLKTESSLASSE